MNYEHDCNACKPLGTCVKGDEEYDLYECGEDLIARYGDEPSKNRSFPKNVAKQLSEGHILRVAYAMSQMQQGK